MAPIAGRALAHAPDAAPADADPVALLEVLDDEIDHGAEHGFRLLLSHLMIFGDLGRQVLQGHRGQCARLCRLLCCHGYRTPSSVRKANGFRRATESRSTA